VDLLISDLLSSLAWYWDYVHTPKVATKTSFDYVFPGNGSYADNNELAAGNIESLKPHRYLSGRLRL
jgi:hypothetical protein